MFGTFQLKEAFKDINEVPEIDTWRLPLLDQLLVERLEMESCGEDSVEVTALIDSLCSS